MNQEIDFKEIWNWLNNSVDWLFYGIVILFASNLLFGMYFAWTVYAQPEFFKKYKLNRSSQFVKQAKNLKSVPPMEEIKVSPPSKEGSLPDKYVKLKSGNLFLPLRARITEQPIKKVKADTEGKSKSRTLPEIEGFSIVGRINGQGKSGKASMLKRKEDGKTFVAEQGEFLEDTDIKVASVTDTMVRLNQPNHQPTNLQFKTDQIEEKIRKQISFR